MGPDAPQFLQMSGEIFSSTRLLVAVCPLSVTLMQTNAPREYTSDLKIQGSAELSKSMTSSRTHMQCKSSLLSNSSTHQEVFIQRKRLRALVKATDDLRLQQLLLESNTQYR